MGIFNNNPILFLCFRLVFGLENLSCLTIHAIAHINHVADKQAERVRPPEIAAFLGGEHMPFILLTSHILIPRGAADFVISQIVANTIIAPTACR